ncbi:MAG TPA: hypothetical protein VGQ99_22385 [Tepidisphaeraceae bacterium]|nr:hypothetical protein [Tepidisphaeraceae bacterium]
MRWSISFAALITLLFACSRSHAITFPHIPVDQLLESDGPDGLVVIGEIAKVAQTELTVEGAKRPFSIGDLAAGEILRGRSKLPVKIAWRNDTMLPHYKVGDAGVWILRPLAGTDFYQADLPTRLVPLAEKAKVEQILARQAVKVTLDVSGYNARIIRLHIWNTWKTELHLQHPSNRRALSFFITDDLGNAVAPVGRAKVDPAFRELTIAVGEQYIYELPDFEFLTGSALFGFDLQPGRTYSVIAVYRPDKDAPGISSPEKTFATRETAR